MNAYSKDDRPSVTGTIFDIKRYAIHDGPGIRTTVFFKGCPLSCWWCHNPEGRRRDPETIAVRAGGRKGSRENKAIGEVVDVGYLMSEIAKDIIFFDQSGGGVTVSGGEPMMQFAFLSALLEECRKNGISTALDTCGFAPAGDFLKIYDAVDLFLYDIKIMDREEHLRYTGVSNELILDNLKMLAERGRKVVPRIAMIPGITDTGENIEAVARFLAPLETIREISLLRYNKICEDKFERFGIENRLSGFSVQTDEEMRAVIERFEREGCVVISGG